MHKIHPIETKMKAIEQICQQGVQDKTFQLASLKMCFCFFRCFLQNVKMPCFFYSYIIVTYSNSSTDTEHKIIIQPDRTKREQKLLMKELLERRETIPDFRTVVGSGMYGSELCEKLRHAKFSLAIKLKLKKN